MRKITEQISKAFNSSKSLSISNTRTDGASIWLFDNKIVRTRDGQVEFTLADWNTPTTRERLQAVGVRVRTQQGQAYLLADDNSEQPIEDNKWYSAT